MDKDTDKNYVAFISYAEKDKELADKIHQLIRSVIKSRGRPIKVFFARDTLKKEGKPLWKDSLLKSVKQSHCIIPIYTMNSINRPWINYEIGAAAAFGLDIFPVRVENISREEVNRYIPGRNPTIYDIFEENELLHLLLKLYKYIEPTSKEDTLKSRIQKSMNDSSFTQEIIELSRTRWVFIAGSLEIVAQDIRSEIDLESFQLLKRSSCFIYSLAKELLEAGFSIASCPQVPYVGKVVSKTAIEWLYQHGKYTNRFKIAGIYPIDREYRETKELQSESQLNNMWANHLMEFRKSYMVDQEWLIIIGGKEGTQEEYMAAKDMDVKIYPVPCFGGFGEILFQKREYQKGPCMNCQKEKIACDSEYIRNIIQFLKTENVEG